MNNCFPTPFLKIRKAYLFGYSSLDFSIDKFPVPILPVVLATFSTGLLKTLIWGSFETATKVYGSGGISSSSSSSSTFVPLPTKLDLPENNEGPDPKTPLGLGFPNKFVDFENSEIVVDAPNKLPGCENNPLGFSSTFISSFFGCSLYSSEEDS